MDNENHGRHLTVRRWLRVLAVLLALGWIAFLAVLAGTMPPPE